MINVQLLSHSATLDDIEKIIIILYYNLLLENNVIILFAHIAISYA